MAEYNGSIELISGLIQKNKADFPLMEASAVAFYENIEQDGVMVTKEVRLPEKLKEVGVSDKDKQDIINNAVDTVFTDEKYTTLYDDVNENSTAIFGAETGLISRVDTLEEKIAEGDNDKLKIQYEEAESMLYLYEGEELIKPNPEEDIEGNVISSTTVSGGGTGVTLDYRLTLKVLDESTNLTFLDSDKAVIKYRADFIDTTVAEGDDDYLVSATLNYRLTVTSPSGSNSVYTFRAGTNEDLEYDITEYVSLGDNNIKLSVSYTEEVGDDATPVTIQSTKRWVVKIAEMYLTPSASFNELTVKTGDVPFTVKVFGDLNKTLHYILDGKPWKTQENISLTNKDYTITIPMQSHGSHTLEVYLTAMVGDKEVKSTSLYFDIMFAEANNTTPIVRAKVDSSAYLRQYSNIDIYYSAYTLGADETLIDIAINGDYQTTVKGSTIESKWRYTPTDFGEKIITFSVDGVERKRLTLQIEEFPYEISPVLAGLDLDFNPVGRTNQDIDYDVFYNNVEGKEDAYTWTMSDNFDWVNGGWKTDDSGSYFCIKAGTTVTLNYLLFNDEDTVARTEVINNALAYAKGNGKEFKIIFKTTNAAQSNATWLTCQAPASNQTTVGLQMDVHNAYVKSSIDTLTIPYSEEDIIEFDMNIIPPTFTNNEIDFTVKDIPMVMTYEDGTPVQPQVITSAGTSFKQQTAVPITIGSPYCDVHIYRLKAYANYLSDEQILDNFIADARSGEEMANRFVRNQIYDAISGKLTPESLAVACPDLRIIKIAAPRFTNDKKDKVRQSEFEMIYKNGDSVLDNWKATGGIHNGQGTSSNEYGYSGRNLELNMKVKPATLYTITAAEGVYDEDGKYYPKGTVLDEKFDLYTSADPETRLLIEDITTVATVSEDPGTIITLGDGKTVVNKVSLTRDSVPTNYFNIKVNIASSEHANNALMQKRYDRYLPYTSLAELRDPNIKNNMNFFNCVVFIKETDKDLTTHQEFNDNEWHFYSMGNIGDSKKTDDSRANDPDDTSEFCVEIMDWNRALSSFPQNTFIVAPAAFLKGDKMNVLHELINGKYVLTSDASIVEGKTYYVDILEQDDFSEDYTYGFRYLNDDEDAEQIATAKAKWIEFYRFITRDLTTNGVEDAEKVAAWKKEFEDWFILDAALYYYLYTLRYTMVDNRAKNSFWHYGKCSDGKYRFDFWDYDNDTALGIDNAGKLEMSYGVEDHDTDIAGAHYFRAHDSLFFVRVAEYFADELITFLRDLESKNNVVFNSTHLINEFDAWQNEFPEELWRLDYERKYKRTYVGGSGTDWDNAIAKAAQKRFLTEMMNGKKKYQRRQFERNQDFYMSSKFLGNSNRLDSITLRGSGYPDKTPAPDYTIHITPYSNMYINLYGGENLYFHERCYAGQTYSVEYPTEKLDFVYIRGASQLQSLGDLSLMYLQTATLNAGTRLKNIILGNALAGYSNENFKTLEVSNGNKLLESLDIRNLSELTGDLPISGIPSLKKLYAQGTNVSSVTFANNGLLEEAYLPASIKELQLINLFFLKTLQFEGYSNLTSLLISNTAGVDSLSIVSKATNLSRVRITDINWKLDTAELLNRLLKCTDIGSDTKQSVLTGTVHITSTRQAELDAFAAAWPELNVTWDRLIPQFSIIFNNYDGTLIHRELVDQGTTLTAALHDPTKNGVLATPPVKPNSEDGRYTYIFSGWKTANGQNLAGTVIGSQDVTFIAQYKEEVRKYKVEWYSDTEDNNSSIILYETEVPWGASATYVGDIPGKATLEGDVLYYLFNGWDKSSVNIQHDLKIYPVWASSNPYELSKDHTLLTAADLNGLKKAPNRLLTKYFTRTNEDGTKEEMWGKSIYMQLGYMPTYTDVAQKILIDNKTIFDGTEDNVLVFDDVALFDSNKSFTLAIDFEMEYSSTTNTLISCFARNVNGFKISTSSLDTVPTFEYKTGEKLAVGHIAPTAERGHREICVIRKNKNEQKLYVYTHNRYSFSSSVVEHEFDGEVMFSPIVNKLCLGALLSADQTSGAQELSELGKGKIYYAKLWYDDLGAEECKNICSWIYDNMEFQFVGSGRYQMGGGGLNAQASFVAKNLLDEPMVFEQDPNDESGFGNSDIKKWLNSKVFLGTSLQWKQILQKVYVPSLKSKPYNANFTEELYLPTPEEYFYIPARAEMSSGVKAPYSKELSPATTCYPIFTEKEEVSDFARVKTLGDSNYAYSYLTRSPNSGTTNRQYGVGPDGKVGVSWKPEGTTNTLYYFYKNSEKHGVLLAFSL